MEKRIELEKRGRPANQVTELILDNCRSTSIVGLTDDFTGLQTLSLINVGLTTLKGFPTLPNLKKLELSDNRISSGLSHLATSTKLTHLNLSGNKIKDLEELKALEQFKALLVLDLFNNEATSIDSYREKIFALIPSLKYLDGFDANEVEAQSDDDEDIGNDSEGEDAGAFSINGLEFDLDELERFEQKLKAIRAAAAAAGAAASSDVQSLAENNAEQGLDELDDYLSQLVIDADRQQNHSVDNDSSTMEPSLPIEPPPLPPQTAPQPAPVLLYFALGLLFFVSTVLANSPTTTSALTLSDEAEGEEDDDDEEDTDDEVSLAEVYNDNLEEDHSDYVEEAEGEEDDDDEEDTDDEETAAAAVAVGEAAAGAAAATGGAVDAVEEESPARGKKRKHDV